MNIVKEYFQGKTKIRIHDDYINTENKNTVNEIIVSMMIDYIKNKSV